MGTKIPRFYSTKELPEKSSLPHISPQMASKPYEAMAGAGEKIEGLGLHAANVFYQKEKQREAEAKAAEEKEQKVSQQKARVEAKEKEIVDKAAEAVTVDKVGHEISDEYEKKLFSYGERTDQGNLEKDAQTYNETAMSKWASDPRIAGNPRVSAAIEKHVRDEGAKLVTGTRRQRAIIVGKEGDAAWERDKMDAIVKWGQEIDPVKKEIAITNLAIKGEYFVGKGVLYRDKYEADMRAIRGDAEKSELITLTDVNPRQAIINIDNKVYKTFSNTELAQRRILAEHSLESKKAKQEREILKSYEIIQNDFLEKLQAGTLTELEVLRSKLPATGLGQGDKTWFIDKINAKRMKGDEAFIHSNPRVYGETLKSIVDNPNKWDKDKIWALMGTSDNQGKPTGLNPNDTAQLYNHWVKAMSTDPAIAKKYGAYPQAVDRLEEYRKNFFFIEPSGKEVSKEEVIKNDQGHYLALQQLQGRVDKGEDPFEALSAIMVKPTQEKAKSWYDKYFSGFEWNWNLIKSIVPSAPTKPLTPKPSSPPPENKEGRYDVNGVQWNWTKAKGWYQ